ncbi:MAG: spermidine/putrescine transporter, substrate-binding protein, partial [Rhizobacter sp.]|nr:spermidine/putrescine transporter, substrate-binding protein [Rhizobacter sp.]
SHKAFLDALIPKYEAQNHCKVIFEGTRSLVNLEKMVNNKAKPYMSVVMMDDPVMILAVKENVLDRMSTANVPNLGKLKPGTVHMDGFWANYMQSTTGVAVNTAKVKAVPSYASLWEPQYKGRIVIPTLQNTEGLAMFLYAAALETGKPLKEAQYLPDAAFKKLAALKPNLLTVYTQVPQALNLLEQGEASMIGGMIGFNAFERKAKGAPIDLILPKEGGMAMPTGIAKVKGGPSAELAYAFINDMLGQFQRQIADISLALPANVDMPAPSNVPKGDVFVPDWNYVSEQRKVWVERWDREMAI